MVGFWGFLVKSCYGNLDYGYTLEFCYLFVQAYVVLMWAILSYPM